MSSTSNILLIILGGGYSIVCVSEYAGGVLQIKSKAHNHFGGQAFVHRMVSYFVQEFKKKHKKTLIHDQLVMLRLHDACERAMAMLSLSTEARIILDNICEGICFFFIFLKLDVQFHFVNYLFSHSGIDFHSSITRASFEYLNSDLFRLSTIELMTKAIREAKMEKSQIKEVVLVGGCSRIPKIRELIQNFFDGKSLNTSIDRQLAASQGAAIIAAILLVIKQSFIISSQLQILIYIDII